MIGYCDWPMNKNSTNLMRPRILIFSQSDYHKVIHHVIFKLTLQYPSEIKMKKSIKLESLIALIFLGIFVYRRFISPSFKQIQPKHFGKKFEILLPLYNINYT